MYSVLRVLKGLRETRGAQAVQEWYHGAMGYRKFGLRYDDLIPDEDPLVVEALHRLPAKERYDREFRFKRALMASGRQDPCLPKAEWTKPEEDYAYLRPVLAQVEAEQLERQAFDNMDKVPRHYLRKNRA